LSSPSRKDIPLSPSGKSNDLTPRVSPKWGADRDRHERAVGCGGNRAYVRSVCEGAAFLAASALMFEMHGIA